MTVRALDANGDIVTRESSFITGQAEIAQTIKTRLALYLGEYFRNIKEGTPWYEQILGKFTSLDVVESVLRNRIAGTPGVIRLTGFNTDFDIENRKYSLTASVLTEYGIVEVQYNG